MSLRLYRKYILLIGAIFITVFLLTSIAYFNDNRLNKNVESENPNQRFLVRDMANRRLESAQFNALTNVSHEEVNIYRKNFVKQMMLFAWNNYKTYAWGENELKPKSRFGHSTSVFGSAHLGASIVDAIDTLHIMGLMDEFNEAREWIANSFNMRLARGELSVFETNIRFVGGLLSTYALTADKMFLNKAQEVADLLLPAFNTPTGIPLALVNMQTGRANNYGWASGGCSILSEFGSLEMEFDFLSRLTGNKTYVNKARHIREFLNQMDKPDGLYPLYLNPKTGKFCLQHFSVGALGDSFFEYLLKVWLLNNRTDSEIKEVYDRAIEAIEKNLLFKSKPSNLWYFAEKKSSRIEHKMAHLTCFIGGMFALQSKYETDSEKRKHYLELAEQVANTCHESYIRADTGIGPETFRFNNKKEATSPDNEFYYILRPEVIESWFVLYRITGNNKYREWCWAAVEAIERYCKVRAGYSGIRNVYRTDGEDLHDDVQQSFFLAETLKYLYLTFTEPDEIPLEKWVFNTEGHPFPVIDT